MASPHLLPPRAGVPRSKSGTIDLSDHYDRRLLVWRDALLRQGSNDMQNWQSFQEVERIIDYLNGNWWGKDRPAYRSNFYDNVMADVRRESLSSLSDIRPSIDISSNVPAYEQQATTVDKYIRHLWWRHNLDMKIVTWIDHGLFGAGFMKLVASENNFLFSAHGPDSVIPVQCDGDIQQSSAVIYRAYKSLGYFQNSFGPEKCIGLERQSTKLAERIGQDRYTRPDGIPEYSWQALSPRFKRRVSMRNAPIQQQTASYTPFPIIELQEIYYDDWSINETNHDIWVHHPDLTREQHNYHYIVPPGCRLYPRKRLVVFAGDRVMYDGPSPFWHGLYPFSMLQLNPCVWGPGGISKYHDLVPLVRSINRVGSGIDEAVMRALNGTFVAKRGAIPEAVWNAFQPGKPGQKILLNPIANINEFKEMTAPQLPSQVEQWLKYLVDDAKRRSGSLDISGLSRKKQVPGADAVEQMRDSMSSPFRLEGRYLEVALEDAGEQLVSNIFQYATLDSRLRILGSDGVTPEDFDYRANELTPDSENQYDHWRGFPIKVAPGSSHASSRSTKILQAFAMFSAGALSIEGLYEQTQFPAKAKVEMARLMDEHQKGLHSGGKSPRQSRGARTGKPGAA